MLELCPTFPFREFTTNYTIDMQPNFSTPVRTSAYATAVAGLLFMGSLPARAQVLFYDNFNGPTLNSAWNAYLPAATITGPPPGSYVGAPTYSFQTVDGASVLRMNENINGYTRVGWSTSSTFTGSGFRYEARFNTLTQGTTSSIDAFFELWVFDPSNPARYDKICPFGGNYGSTPELAWTSSIDNTDGAVAVSYQNNRWYRLVIQGGPGQDIRMSIDDDTGAEIFGQTLNHGFGAYGSGIDLAISQAMGSASVGPSDVAVDWVQLSVPEPGTGVLLLAGLAGCLFWARRRQPQPGAAR